MITRNLRKPLALLEHADCYAEVCRLEREIVRLREELAEARSCYVRETTRPDFNVTAEDW